MSPTSSRLLLCAATTSALAAGTLALGVSAPAGAAPATTSYLCYFEELQDADDVEVPLTVDVTNLPTRLPVGVPVKAGAWNVSANLVLNEVTTTYLLTRSTEISVKIEPLDLLFGDKETPVGLASAVQSVPLAQPLNVPLTGTNSEFTPKFWADDLPLEMPEALTLDFYDRAGALLLSADCDWGDGDIGVIGEVSVVKQTASLTRKLLTKPVKQNKRAKVLVTVESETGEAAPGEVMAMLGGRNLVVGELQDGRVTLKLPKLPVGKHKVTLSYLGAKYVDKAERSITVKVVAPRRK